jgi:hypothetical protein
MYLDNKSLHIDWCAVDWTTPDLKFVLALKHESGGLLGGVPGVTFVQSWKVYLAAVSFGLILIVGLNLMMPPRRFGSVELLAIQAGATRLASW